MNDAQINTNNHTQRMTSSHPNNSHRGGERWGTHREERGENMEAAGGETEEGKMSVKFRFVCFAISAGLSFSFFMFNKRAEGTDGRV